MKQKHVLLLSAILTLCLTACNNSQNGNNSKGNGGKESSNNSQSSEPAQTPFVEPTMDLQFESIEDNCMVPSYVKDYIDQMHTQEDSITYPHRVSNLGCNMDWKTASDYAEHRDGTVYDDDHSGGVDVCQILNRNLKYENKPIELKWDASYPEAKVVFWSKADKSDKREVAVASDGISAKLPNLFRNTKYYYQVVNGDDASQMKNFVTGDYTRMITMGDISNVRDMGGYMTSYGVRTNQGLIYRGGEMAVAAFSDGGNRHSANWTDAAQEVQKDVLNIGLELDLRTKSGSNSMTESPLEFEGDWLSEPYDGAALYPNTNTSNENGRAQYVRCAINSFHNYLTDPNRTSEGDNANRNLVKEIFNYMSHADEQHVYFHCWGGADRTGVTGFLLLGILGATYTDAIIDFELTTLTNNKRCHMHNSTNADFPKFLYKFVTSQSFTRDGQTYTYTYDGEKTLRYNSEQLLLAMGVEEETIEKIRTIMLPGYETGKSQETEAENKGWHK